MLSHRWSDSLLRHLKDQHHNASNSGPPAPVVARPDSDTAQVSLVHVPVHHLMETNPDHNINVAVPEFDDPNGTSVAIYSDQGPPQSGFQSSPRMIQSQWNANIELPGNIFPDDTQTTFSTEDWLAYGNFDDSLLRDWPFVVDNTDLGRMRVNDTYDSGKPIADLQHLWHTHLEKDEPAVSGYTTPLPNQNLDVDDSYRQSLHHRLQIRALDTTLPSADFLNLCVRAYFKGFHPIFPIIHAATFRPSKTNAVLLLSICSIGSLLTGHPAAVSRGIQLFERLNKAILSNWEALMRKGPEQNFAMIQAALLGQTFGLLSGQANHLVLVETFHGTIVAWARRSKIFHEHHQPSCLQDLKSRWREWARTEEKIRLGMALHIHDAELSSTLHQEMFLSVSSRRPRYSDSDAFFSASTPQEWAALYDQRPGAMETPLSEPSPRSACPNVLFDQLLSIPNNCHFAISSTLEDILSAVLQAKSDGSLTEEYTRKVHTCLVGFYHQYRADSAVIRHDVLPCGNMVLWHLIWISLHADMELLERSVGRDGSKLCQSDLTNVQEWAESPDARRVVAHAMTIRKVMEHFPLTSEPAIHIPRALFYSAICLFCYSKYGSSLGEQNKWDFPEFQLLHVNVASLLRGAKGSSSRNDEDFGPVYGFADLLQRIGHYEVSRKFASILGVVIHAEAN